MRFWLTLLMFMWGSSALADSTCNKLSQDLAMVLQTEPQWRIVDVNDLVDDDQILWEKYHSGLCPGMVSVNLTGNGPRSYALALIKNDKEHRISEKLIIATLINDQIVKHTLVPSTNIMYTDVASPFVVWKISSGSYHDLKTGLQIKVPHEGFVFEKMEATATLYFYLNNRYRSILLSE